MDEGQSSQCQTGIRSRTSEVWDLKGNEMSGYGAAADDAIPRLT